LQYGCNKGVLAQGEDPFVFSILLLRFTCKQGKSGEGVIRTHETT